MKYNPSFLSEAELKEAFVVRGEELHVLVSGLIENTSAAAAQHWLILGERGAGKTMLVRSAAARLRETNQELIPVVFPEESYSILSLSDFWLEALRLAAHETATENLKNAHQKLLAETDSNRATILARGVLLDFAEKTRRRFILFVENIDQILEQMNDPSAEWALRETLVNEPQLTLVTTATSEFEAVNSEGRALYGLFRRLNLNPLTDQEALKLWKVLAPVSEIDLRAIRGLNHLTGGNPRLLGVLTSFSEGASLSSLQEEIKLLIDENTDYFKSRIEILPPQERKVFVALLEFWKPVPASMIAETTKIKRTSLPPILDRLQNRGYVAQVRYPHIRGSHYHVRERLFSIYWQMRRGGNAAERVRAFIEFIVIYYGDHPEKGIAGLAAQALKESERTSYFEALRALVEKYKPTSPEDIFGLFSLPFLLLEDFPEDILDKGKFANAEQAKLIRKAAEVASAIFPEMDFNGETRKEWRTEAEKVIPAESLPEVETKLASVLESLQPEDKLVVIFAGLLALLFFLSKTDLFERMTQEALVFFLERYERVKSSTSWLSSNRTTLEDLRNHLPEVKPILDQSLAILELWEKARGHHDWKIITTDLAYIFPALVAEKTFGENRPSSEKEEIRTLFLNHQNPCARFVGKTIDQSDWDKITVEASSAVKEGADPAAIFILTGKKIINGGLAFEETIQILRRIFGKQAWLYEGVFVAFTPRKLVDFGHLVDYPSFQAIFTRDRITLEKFILGDYAYLRPWFELGWLFHQGNIEEALEPFRGLFGTPWWKVIAEEGILDWILMLTAAGKGKEVLQILESENAFEHYDPTILKGALLDSESEPIPQEIRDIVLDLKKDIAQLKKSFWLGFSNS